MMKGSLSVGRLSRCVSLQLTSGLTLGTEKLVNNGASNVCRLSRRASPSQLATGLTRRCFGSWPKVYPKRVRVITMVSAAMIGISVMDMAITRRTNLSFSTVLPYVGCNRNSCFLLRKSRRALLGGSTKVRRRHVSRCTHQ
jgi:hypothetical protein